MSQVHHNMRGGIQVTDEEIETAFQFFDNEGTGIIKANVLQDRLDVLKNKINLKQLQNLLNNMDGVTLNDVKQFMRNNDFNNMDPFEEVYEALDPSRRGFIDTDILQNLFRTLKFGFSTEDINIVAAIIDQSNNDRIRKEEFRNMFTEKK